jgi:hypothetical protein
MQKTAGFSLSNILNSPDFPLATRQKYFQPYAYPKTPDLAGTPEEWLH